MMIDDNRAGIAGGRTTDDAEESTTGLLLQTKKTVVVDDKVALEAPTSPLSGGALAAEVVYFSPFGAFLKLWPYMKNDHTFMDKKWAYALFLQKLLFAEVQEVDGDIIHKRSLQKTIIII